MITIQSWRQWSDSFTAAAAAKSLQSCPTLCDPTDGSPPGSPVPGILQARILEWVAISFSNAWKWKVKVKSLSCVQLFSTPWTAAYQAPPSMGFSRQEYWSGVPLPSLIALQYWGKNCQPRILYLVKNIYIYIFQNKGKIRDFSQICTIWNNSSPANLQYRNTNSFSYTRQKEN